MYFGTYFNFFHNVHLPQTSQEYKCIKILNLVSNLLLHLNLKFVIAFKSQNILYDPKIN